MTPSIEAKILVIEQETGIGANTKLRIGEVLREIANEKPYKVYTALLTQSGTNAPVATVLENTLGGEVVWSREDVGIYSGTLSGVFTLDKTYISTGIFDTAFTDAVGYVNTDLTSRPNSVSLGTFDIPTDTASDGLLYATSIEIRVYN